MADIERLTFLVHPFCYAPSLVCPDGFPADRFVAYRAHEAEVARRWEALIDALGATDGLIYHPCYESREELALADRARRRLGQRFLRLGSRQELYTPEVMAALAPEIAAAFAARGKYSWSVHDLRVAAFSYYYAMDVSAAFRQRGLSVDPGGLSMQAVGESFEGCATTWSTMVPHFLAAPGRVEIPYELTVPDTYFLLGCQYLGRTELDCDTALHLFRDGDRIVAHFKRERVALAEPSYYARMAVDPAPLSVVSGQGDQLLAPGGDLTPTVPPSLLRRGDNYIEVMISTGRGRGGEGPPYVPREASLFVIAESAGADDLAAAAQAAQVVAAEPI
jgi:hypothetical protein